MTIERPLDMLNDYKNNGKNVKVSIKNKDDPVEGLLVAFDIHINLVLMQDKTPLFIRGDIVETISPSN